MKPPGELTAEELGAKLEREEEEAPKTREGVEEAEPKNGKPPRERTTKE